MKRTIVRKGKSVKSFTVFQVDNKIQQKARKCPVVHYLWIWIFTKDFALTKSIFSQVHISADQKQVNVITSVIGEGNTEVQKAI